MFTQRWRYRKYCQNIYATKGPKFWAKVSPRAFGKQNEKNIENIYSFQIMISNKDYKFIELKKYGKSKLSFYN